MPNPYFQFKQFTIYQDKCAMKVGTDGTLLGAWADVSSCKRILDIGTGTGLIALMIAQRNKDAVIDAIDIDIDACTQASENVKNSLFSKQITIRHSSFQSFAKTIKTPYDLIVSNPPYFTDSLKSPEKKRNLARHNDALSLPELINVSCSLLSAHGRIALILPYHEKDKLLHYATLNKLYCIRQTNVIPTAGGQPKRLLAELSPQNIYSIPEDLTLEQTRNQRTEEYQILTKDFYL
ncbi:MAG: methyltransferase [Tannerella sp.]|jgi:tRNA1Val (adenine37-N6)-methyltransferase|nr:methyltransferase [Tannerella sp.]